MADATRATDSWRFASGFDAIAASISRRLRECVPRFEPGGFRIAAFDERTDDSGARSIAECVGSESGSAACASATSDGRAGQGR